MWMGADGGVTDTRVQKTTSAGGNPVFVEDLFAHPFLHGHVVIDRESCTILCQGVKCSFGMVYHPVLFKDRASAWEWITKGSIGGLQESFTNLAVGFTNRHRPATIPNRFQ
mgnify:FL=1